MKRKITILSIFMIAIMLLTSNVFAVETFTHEGSTYVIDEAKLKLDTLSEDIELIGMDENNNYIIGDESTNLIYKVNEKECTEMSMQDLLDYMNNDGLDIYNDVDDDFNIYQEKSPMFGWFGEYDYETEEQTHETAFFVSPKSATIDENITYYEYDSEESIMVKVENPKEEEIVSYAIIGNPEDYQVITKIGQMTQETYNKIFSAQTMMYYIHYDEENKEIYILMNYIDDEKSVIYKADGTIVVEYDELMFMEPLGNKFFIVAKCNEEWELIEDKVTIIDTNGNKVFESESIPYFSTTLGYSKYTIYLESGDSWDVLGLYNMYEYKLLSDDNQKYEGKDLTIKTSGELSRLTSVKVNGVELDASNYTKTSGSTIITLKNDYLKTLPLGTYTLELGYVDGTKIETKFVIDKIYSDNANDGNEGNTASGTTAQGKGDKDDTPKTGINQKNEVVFYSTILLITIVGVFVAKIKIED